jgi:hypothetical protein
MKLSTVDGRRKQYIALMQKRIQPGSGSSLQLMSQRNMQYPVTDIGSIIHETSYVVVGGVATSLYMPERMTEDLDILVLTEDIAKLHQELIQAGSQQVGELTIGGTTWQLPDGTLLDVITSNQTWVSVALQSPNVSSLGLPIIRLPYLVLMKLQASRGVDMGDLTRMLGRADDEALAQVRSVIRTYMSNAIEDLESLIQLGKLEYEE